MKRFRALQEKRAKLVAEATGLVNAEAPSAEDTARADVILRTEIPAIDGELERFEALFEAERTAPALEGGRAPATVTPRIESDPLRGFADAAEFATAVRAASRQGGTIDPRLLSLLEESTGVGIGAAPSNYHKEAGSDEGYMVPPAVREAIFSLVFSDDELVSMVNPEPTSSNAVTMLRDESTPWGATGISAAWGAEGSQLSPSKLETKSELVRLYKLHAYALATDELLEDAPRLEARLTKGAAAAISYTAGAAIVNGNGVGKPLGFGASSGSAALVTVAKEGSQAAATVVAANVAKMYARAINPGRGFWLVNQDVLPQLLTMTLGDQPIFIPPNQGIQSAPGGFLLGRPVKFAEHCETLGTVGDIYFVNPDGYYAVVKRGGVKFASSMHLFFDYAIGAFRWTFRLGGRPFLSAPVSPAKGSSTRSHFVALATRS